MFHLTLITEGSFAGCLVVLHVAKLTNDIELSIITPHGQVTHSGAISMFFESNLLSANDLVGAIVHAEPPDLALKQHGLTSEFFIFPDEKE